MESERIGRIARWMLPAALILLVLPGAPTVDAGQFTDSGLDGWAYRMPVNVTFSAVENDVDIVFTVPTASLIAAGKMRSDCGDVRVTSDFGYVIPHWIESGCGGSARVWTRMPYSTDQALLHVVYGNPNATSTSQTNATFVGNRTWVEEVDCPTSNCSFLNHAAADAYRNLAPTCKVSRIKLDYGDPCLATVYGSAEAPDPFVAEYRFLFVPDVNGSWQFEWSASPYGELATSATDEEIVTSHSVLNADYVFHALNSTIVVNRTLTAGQGSFYSFLHTSSFLTSGEGSRLRLKRPGGASFLDLNSANFPNMYLRRNYPTASWTATLGPEEGLPSVPVITAAHTDFDTILVDGAAPPDYGGLALEGPGTGYNVYTSWTPAGPWWNGSAYDHLPVRLGMTGVGVGQYIRASAFNANGASDLSDVVYVPGRDPPATPEFWDRPAGWAYRQPLTITLPAAVAGGTMDLNLALNVSTASLISAGKLQSDCDDLRFRMDDGRLVDHWLESGCGGTARVWLQLAGVPVGSTLHLEMYYGNASAASVSSVNNTFYHDAFHYEVNDCDPSANGSTCPITSAATANAVRARGNVICEGILKSLDLGYACMGSAGGTNSIDSFATEYHFLFVPDVSGFWGFETRSDNWSDLSFSDTDAYLTTSYTPIVTNYLDNHLTLSNNVSMTAGVPKWISYVSSDKNGVEEQRLRISRPGGSLQVLSDANFPGLMFHRGDSYGSRPSVAFSAEEQLPGSPSAVATPWDQQINLTITPPSFTGGSFVMGYLISTPTGAAMPLPVNATSINASPLSVTLTGLADDTSYLFKIQPYTSRGINGSYQLSAATLGAPTNNVTGLVGTPTNHTITVNWDGVVGDFYHPISGFRIYLTRDDGADSRVFVTNNPANTSYTIGGLNNGLLYHVQVAKWNVVGIGPLGDPADATPGANPYPPGNLAATRGNTNVTLSWTQGLSNGASITGYQIWKGTSSGAATLLATASGSSNTSFVANGLTNGQTYFFNVTAVNSFGTSNSSNEVSATPATTPSPPQSFAASANNRSVVLTWAAPASNGGLPVSGFSIYAETTPVSGGIDLLASTSNGANTSFMVNGLTNGVQYAFSVVANNAVGSSAFPSFPTATPGSRPNPPASLVATSGQGLATLTWTAGSNQGSALTSYHIWRGTSAGTESVIATTGSGANTSFIVNGLTNGTQYFFNVTAVNAFGMSNSSNEANTTPLGVPGVPLGFTLARGNSRIDLNWTAGITNGRPIDNYSLWRGTSPFAATPLATIGTNVSYVDLNVTPGTTYYYNVSAHNAIGWGASSPQLNATAATTPGAPSTPSATASDHRISLGWTPAGGTGGDPIVNYRIRKDGLTFAFTGGANTTFDANGLTNGQNYTFTISAINAIGEGVAGGGITQSPAGVPFAPGNVTATRGNGSVSVAWSAANGNGRSILIYKVYAGTTSGATSYVISTTALSYDITGLTNGVPEYVNVTAVSQMGEGASSLELSATPAGRPSAPTAPTLTPMDGKLKIDWGAAAANGDPLVNYSVYLGTATNPPLFAGTGGANTTFTANGLTNGATYNVSVSAWNTLGESARSAFASEIPATVPSAPGGSLATFGNQSVNVSWSAPAGNGRPVVRYHVYAGTGTPTSWVGTTTNRYLVVNGLTNGVTYLFNVSAENAMGNGSSSTLANAMPRTIPNPPQLDSMVRGNRTIALAWTNGTDGGGALLRTRILGGTTPNPTSVLADLPSTNTSYTLTGLANGQTYYVRLVHTNDVGVSNPSNERNARPAAIPNPPTNLVAQFGNANATLTWSNGGTNGEPLTGHTIYLGTSPTNTPPLATSGANTSFVVNGLQNGVTYYVRVASSNNVGLGNASAAVNVTPARAPDAPTSFEALVTSGQASLQWHAPDFNGGRNVSNYNVYQRTGSGALVRIATIGTNTSFVASNLQDGTTYGFAVDAQNLVGNGTRTSELVGMPARAPDAPTLTSTTLTASAITIQWTPSFNGGRPLQQYRLYAAQSDATEEWLVATLPGSQTSYVDNAPAGSVRSYRISGVNALGEGPQSAPRTGMSLPDPLDPQIPDTYRSCARDDTSGTATCSPGSSLAVEQLVAGARHTCVVLSDDKVDCWGDMTSGQAADHLSGRPALAVAAGTGQTCVLRDDRNVDCYGNDAFGAATSYLGGDASAVAIGNGHVCMLKINGSVACQGANGQGQATGRASGVAAIGAGSYHTCFVLTSGVVQCQGLNDRGQASPPALSDAQTIVGGQFHACTLRNAMQVSCWGSISGASLVPPTGVQGQTLQLASGKSHVCALLTSGDVRCWGSDRDGQSAPYNGHDAIAVAAGESHTCVLRAAHDVVCWGSNPATDHGQGQSYPGTAAPNQAPAPAAPAASEGALAAPITSRRPDHSMEES